MSIELLQIYCSIIPSFFSLLVFLTFVACAVLCLFFFFHLWHFIYARPDILQSAATICLSLDLCSTSIARQKLDALCVLHTLDFTDFLCKNNFHQASTVNSEEGIPTACCPHHALLLTVVGFEKFLSVSETFCCVCLRFSLKHTRASSTSPLNSPKTAFVSFALFTPFCERCRARGQLSCLCFLLFSFVCNSAPVGV